MSPKIVRLFATAALCAAWALLALAGGAAAQGKGEKKLPKLLAAKPLDTGAESDDLRQLIRARYNAALDEARGRYRQLQEGHGNLGQLFDAFRRLLAAGVAIADTGKTRLLFLEEYVDLTRAAERMAAEHAKAGQMPSVEAAQARYMRLDAEIQLLRARRLLTGPKPTPVP
jgi:hypothetical protein